MIKGNIRTEKEYRQLEVDSSSSLKVFSQDRRKYFKTYFEGIKEPDEESKASIVGRLVDTLLLEKEEFDNRFCMSCLAKAPAPNTNMGMFVEALYKHTKEATVDGVVSKSFEELSKEAYKDSGYKISFEKVIEKFVGNDPEIYYKELLEIRGKGLTVVTSDDIQNAERIIEELKINEFIAPIVNQVTDDKHEVFNQLQIDGFDIDGLQLKAMLDKVIVNHTTKTIDIYDLKCVWAVENFYEQYYLYRRAYIQEYVYYWAVKHWKEEVGFEDYHVNYPKFIVCDSINYYKPLIYVGNGASLGKGYDGFTYKNESYPGVRDIIKDIKWAKDNNNWTISRVNYENEGRVNL